MSTQTGNAAMIRVDQDVGITLATSDVQDIQMIGWDNPYSLEAISPAQAVPILQEKAVKQDLMRAEEQFTLKLPLLSVERSNYYNLTLSDPEKIIKDFRYFY
jgi:hypothetical protein